MKQLFVGHALLRLLHTKAISGSTSYELIEHTVYLVSISQFDPKCFFFASSVILYRGCKIKMAENQGHRFP